VVRPITLNVLLVIASGEIVIKCELTTCIFMVVHLCAQTNCLCSNVQNTAYYWIFCSFLPWFA